MRWRSGGSGAVLRRGRRCGSDIVSREYNVYACTCASRVHVHVRSALRLFPNLLPSTFEEKHQKVCTCMHMHAHACTWSLHAHHVSMRQNEAQGGTLRLGHPRQNESTDLDVGPSRARPPSPE